MPKAEIPANYAEAAAHGTYGPTSWVNVFYFHVPTPGAHTPSDIISGIGLAVRGFYKDGMGVTALPDNWGLQYTRVTYRGNDGSLNRARVVDAVDGTGTGARQDAQVSYLVNWSTDDARRGGKPRTYVTGVMDGAVADCANLLGTFLSGRFTTLNEWLVNIQDGTTYPPVALALVDMSFRDGKAWRTTPQPFPISIASINPVVASQRRRIDRVRPV